MKIAHELTDIYILIRKLIFFALIPLFISCTVTKRVHRPGYHIQWRKIERTKSQNVTKPTVLAKKEKEKPIIRQTIALSETANPEIQPTIQSETNEISSYSDDLAEVSAQPDLVRNTPQSLSHESQSSSESITIHQINRPLFWRMSPITLRKIGVFFIVFGIMLLFASMLVSFGAFSGNGNGAWINFFLDLIDISGWFWLLFFILIIILVSYLLFLFVFHVLGGPITGAILGIVFLAVGIFFYTLGNRREIEP